jgi:hypothetical protein
MTATQHIRFRLDISAEDYLAYYQGAVRDVLVRAEDGRRVKFPAGALQPHITRDGIHGRFELRFDANHKLIGLQRLGD